MNDGDTSSDEYLQEAAYCVTKDKFNGRSAWCLDSGATRHMTNDINFFEHLDSEYRSKVRVASKDYCEVYGIGSRKIKCMTSKGIQNLLELRNVLFVPSFDSGLLSIRALDRDGYNIIVKDNKMTVFKEKEQIATSDIEGELYILRTELCALKVSSTHKENCIHRWHERLGHRNEQAIKKLIDENMATGIQIEHYE